MTELPHEHRQRWLLERYSRLHQGGAEPVSGLVQPTAAFFPDPFERSVAGVRRLLARVLKLAGMSDVPVELSVPQPADPLAAGGCSTGGCGPGAPPSAKVRRVVETEEGFRVSVLPQEVGHPTVLTTSLVRAVSHIFLLEAELYEDVHPAEAELVTDLAGTALGFGVLLANGAYIYAKGCGGVNVSSATRMPVEEVALALAIHTQVHGIAPRLARKHLETTPRAHYEEAAAWAASNASVVDLVAHDPVAIAAGSYTLSEARGWLARVLRRGRSRGTSAPSSAELAEMAASVKRQKRATVDSESAHLADLRDLVDEAFERSAPGEHGA